MKYFIKAWDDDSELKRYSDFYYIGDKNGQLLLFDSIRIAELFGCKYCKYFNVCDWHNYMSGGNNLNTEITKLKIKGHPSMFRDHDNKDKIGESAAEHMRFMNLME